MIKYKQVNAANGRTMYYKNGTMVSKTEIPKGILNTLEPGVELEVSSGNEGTTPAQPSTAPLLPEEEEERAPNSAIPLERPGGSVDPLTVDAKPKSKAKSKSNKRSCIFCGELATRTRFVNLQTADLCEEDYSSHTTGEIAAQMRQTSKK